MHDVERGRVERRVRRVQAVVDLTRVGLGRFCVQLDESVRWERELNEDEQHALALARVLTHQPPWLIIDEVLDSLDDTSLERAIDIFTKDLAKSTIIHIGRNDGHNTFSRVLHLIKDPDGNKLPPIPAPAAASPALATSS